MITKESDGSPDYNGRERIGKGDICENSDQRETVPSPRDQEGFFRNRSNGFGSPRHALSVP